MKAVSSVIVLWVLFLGAMAPDALALTSLKQVKVTGGPLKNVDVSLTFDRRVNPESAQVEFIKDVIQITLKDTSVYPPKIIPVNGKAITKVFAYQFSPKTVRCRLFVRGNAEDFKDRVFISKSNLQGEMSGKVLNIRVAALSGGASEAPRAFEEVKAETRSDVGSKPAFKEVVTQNLGKESPHESEKNLNSRPSSEADLRQEQEEKALLDKVLRASNGEKAADLGAGAALSGKDSETRSTGDKLTGEKGNSEKLTTEKLSTEKLTSGKALPSFKGVFLKLGAVVLLALLMAWAVKKLRSGKKKSGVLGAIQRMANGALLPKNERLIQVVSTHHIDPKKSIAVVKIAGRLLVLGLSNDSINLITQFGEEGDPFSGADLGEKAFAEDAPFTDLLRSEKLKPSLTESTGPSLIPSVRSRIKSRLEGLKPL